MSCLNVSISRFSSIPDHPKVQPSLRTRMLKQCFKNFSVHMHYLDSYSNVDSGTSLVAQWLRICLPIEGTLVGSLVGEDPTCRGATKVVHHNY